MPSSYSGDPAGNDVDRVRFFANDKAAPFHLTDEEIEFLITQAGSADIAAADAAEMIAGGLSTKADKSVGPLRISYSQQSDSYMHLAERLRSRAAKRGGGPILTQTDRPPYFSLGQWDRSLVPPTSQTGNDIVDVFDNGDYITISVVEP